MAVRTHLPDDGTVRFPDAPRRVWPGKLEDEAEVRRALAGSLRRRLVRMSRRHHADGLLR